MNLWEFLVLIVLIGTIGSLIRVSMGVRKDHKGNEYYIRDKADDAETLRLRDEVKQLRERMAVIERITIEKESSLEREIDRLRDR